MKLFDFFFLIENTIAYIMYRTHKFCKSNINDVRIGLDMFINMISHALLRCCEGSDFIPKHKV